MNKSLRALTVTLAACLLGTAAVHAQTVITSLPYTITSGGNYVLNSNLNSSQTSGNLITVSASNVTIDFQNYFIAGAVGNTNQTTIGIYASEKSNITIKNGTVAYCYQGINLQGNGTATTNSVDHQIDNMRVTYCYDIGIYVNQSPASRVTNCQVSQIGFSGATNAYGILTFGTNGTVTVANNIVDHVTATTAYGIFVANNNIVRQNTVAYCTYGVLAGKYQDNLTSNCTTPYSGGTDAGGNN